MHVRPKNHHKIGTNVIGKKDNSALSCKMGTIKCNSRLLSLKLAMLVTCDEFGRHLYFESSFLGGLETISITPCYQSIVEIGAKSNYISSTGDDIDCSNHYLIVYGFAQSSHVVTLAAQRLLRGWSHRGYIILMAKSDEDTIHFQKQSRL